MSMLKERLGTPKDKKLPTVDYRSYFDSVPLPFELSSAFMFCL